MELTALCHGVKAPAEPRRELVQVHAKVDAVVGLGEVEVGAVHEDLQLRGPVRAGGRGGLGHASAQVGEKITRGCVA